MAAEKPRRSTRRELLRDAALSAAAAAGVVSLSGTAEAGKGGEATAAAGPMPTKKTKQQTARGKGETPTPEPITAADIAASDRVAGRTATDAEREQMVRALTRSRPGLQKIRSSELTEGQEPAFHFDPRLPGMQVPSGKSGVTLSRGKTPPYDGNPGSLAFLTVADLSRLVKARKVSSAELTRMYLARLKKYGPRLLNVVNLTEERALEQATRADKEIAAGKYRGPLHGIPYGLKDLFATRGYPTTYGVQPYEKQRIDEDATVVRRLEEAGAVLVAKLTMGELAMGDVWFGGTTRNPWKPDRGSSGSSAGPGSASAAGLVGFAIGTETLGSIISPSVVNGTTGLRPTFGRVSRHGAMALSWTMDKIGPMARGVEDCALIFAAIHGPDGLDPTAAEGIPFRWSPGSKLSDLRVGIDQASFDAAVKDKKQGRFYADALEALKRLGITPKKITLPSRTDEYGALAGLFINVEGAASFARFAAAGNLQKLVQQDDWNWPNAFRAGAVIPAVDYIQGMRVRTWLQREMAKVLENIDVYLTVPWNGPSLTYTNLTGHPEVITRCGVTDENLPVSVSFVGNLYREDAALRLAYAFEQATDWHTRWPDMEKLPETPPHMAKPS